MLKVQNKTFQQNSSKNDSHIEYDFNFKQALYRNSKVYRLIILDYLKQSVLHVSSWYTISLELVTEFGLPAQTSLFTSSQVLSISCELLVLNHNRDIPCYSTASNLNIQYRLFTENDAWKNLENGVISLEYRINVNNYQNIPQDIYICFRPLAATNNDHTLLSVCLGPFQLTAQRTLQTSMVWDDSSRNRINLYRVLSLPKPNMYALFQEVWDHGTSGKLWDSAIIMTQVFSHLIQFDRNCLAGKRLLDLSAGIGCVGLSIELFCRMFKTDNPPEIMLTDLEEALPLMKANQRLNYLPFSPRISYKRLKWGIKKDIERASIKPFDYILVLDLVYNEVDFQPLVRTFYHLLEKSENATIIMGYKPRGLKQSEEDAFFNECRLHLKVEQLDLESLYEEFIGRHLGHSASNLEDVVAVCFYKITKKFA